MTRVSSIYMYMYIYFWFTFADWQFETHLSAAHILIIFHKDYHNLK